MQITLDDIHISAINPYITPETLILLDIDNTLVRAKTMLGSAQWFGHTVRTTMAQSEMSREEALRAIYELYLQVSVFTEMVLIEQNLPSLMATWQHQALGVLGLTARHVSNAETTLQQLQANNITFAPATVVQLKRELPMAVPAVLEHGVIFASEMNSKGETLALFLQQLATMQGLPRPKRIIFVDDLSKNTESVMQTLSPDFEVVTLRYGAEDERVQAFDPMIAKIQLDNLAKILPDKVAAEFASVLTRRTGTQ